MITQAELKELFTERNGKLYWKISNGNRTKIGHLAGTKTGRKDYPRCQIVIKYRRYFRSILIYIYHHGKFPRGVIDHINRNTLDDRIENLRDVPVSQNNINRKRPYFGKNKYKYIYFDKHKKTYCFILSNNGQSKTIKRSKDEHWLADYSKKWLKENDPVRYEYLEVRGGG